MISKWLNVGHDHLTIDIFNQAIVQQDPLAVSVLEEVAFYLGMGIVSITNLFNPEKIIVGGELADDNPYFIQKVHEFVAGHSLETHTGELEVLPSSFGNDADVIGAASLLLHELFHFTLSE
ncbi:ROK family protein [Lederbergia sp. NSJ-179]|uniref:ROK family protein n=1 Tax=Lederbergia sp. NSJ-179 TaxID=2931402 RepID=UPI002455FA0D|nr:ROK family protein [Lederbergia sp. NSJ-179]